MLKDVKVFVFFSGNLFDATVFSIPGHLKSLPQSATFNSGELPRISLEDYLVNFVDTYAKDNNIDDARKTTVSPEKESDWWIIVVLIIAIFLLFASMIFALMVNKMRSVGPRIPEKKGESLSENENSAGSNDNVYAVSAFVESASGPAVSPQFATNPPDATHTSHNNFELF